MSFSPDSSLRLAKNTAVPGFEGEPGGIYPILRSCLTFLLPCFYGNRTNIRLNAGDARDPAIEITPLIRAGTSPIGINPGGAGVPSVVGAAEHKMDFDTFPCTCRYC